MNPHNPIPQPPTESQQKVHNPLEVMQPGERVICEIKRHPIGMFGMYAMAGILLVALAIVTLVVLPSVFSDSRASITAIGTIFFLLLALGVVVFVFIANKVYWGNSWVISSDSLTQISQTSLFNKQSSQLSLGNLEDVTVTQHGILAQLFRFGALKAETAGERSKFIFPYCPNPNYYAQKILAAREAFELAHHGGKQEPFNAAANSADQTQVQPPQPQAPPTASPAPVVPEVPDRPPYDNQQNDTFQ